jgi:hypothetical protein
MGRPADEKKTKLHCVENEGRNVEEREEFRVALKHSDDFELFQTPSLQYVLIDGESVENLYLHPGENPKTGKVTGNQLEKCSKGHSDVTVRPVQDECEMKESRNEVDQKWMSLDDRVDAEMAKSSLNSPWTRSDSNDEEIPVLNEE